jgi:hypothetical protein
MRYDARMKSPFSFLRRLLGQDRDSNVLQILTPTMAAERSTGTRLVLAGATMVGLGVFSAIALGAFVTLILALGAIYFLVTQVLGIRLDVDPRVIVQRAQEYAGYAQRN